MEHKGGAKRWCVKVERKGACKRYDWLISLANQIVIV